MLWISLFFRVVFDGEYDPLVRIWVGFSVIWTFAASYWGSLQPGYDPKNVSLEQIWINLAPWIVGPVLVWTIRLLTTGSLRRPKNQ